MNAKKVKAIRAFLRGKGVNPREDRYTEVMNTRRIRSFVTKEVDTAGKPTTGHYQTASHVLAPGCGRSVYHGLKSASA